MNDDYIVKLLLDNKAAVHVSDRAYKFTPLHRATALGNEEMVKTLLAHGADTKAKTSRKCTLYPKMTAKQIAQQEKNKKIIRLLGLTSNGRCMGMPLIFSRIILFFKILLFFIHSPDRPYTTKIRFLEN